MKKRKYEGRFILINVLGDGGWRMTSEGRERIIDWLEDNREKIATSEGKKLARVLYFR